MKSARARPHSILSGIGMSASGSPGWASATTPQGSAVSSKPNPEAPKSPLQPGRHHPVSPREPKLGPRLRHLCRLRQRRRGHPGEEELGPGPEETCFCSPPPWVTWDWCALGNSLSVSHLRPPGNSVFCSPVASCWGWGWGSNFSREEAGLSERCRALRSDSTSSPALLNPSCNAVGPSHGPPLGLSFLSCRMGIKHFSEDTQLSEDAVKSGFLA